MELLHQKAVITGEASWLLIRENSFGGASSLTFKTSITYFHVQTLDIYLVKNKQNFEHKAQFKPLLTRIVNVNSGFQLGFSCLKDKYISIFSRISCRRKHPLSIKFQLFPTKQIIPSMSCFLVNFSLISPTLASIDINIDAYILDVGYVTLSVRQGEVQGHSASMSHRQPGPHWCHPASSANWQ